MESFRPTHRRGGTDFGHVTLTRPAPTVLDDLLSDQLMLLIRAELSREEFDRQAREQNLSLADRHALRLEFAPALLDELHVLLAAMQASDAVLPQSVAGKAINYTLKRWAELTRFLDHPVIELSTNWAENLSQAP